MTTPLYWRIHWLDAPPFSARNAWSVPWGAHGEEGVVPLRGYSCMDSPCGLLGYFNRRAGVPRRGHARLVVFRGDWSGTGLDLEPLVVPTKVIAWLDPEHLGDLCRADDADDDADVMRLVRRLREPAPTAAERSQERVRAAREAERAVLVHNAACDALQWGSREIFGVMPWEVPRTFPLSHSDLHAVDTLVRDEAWRGVPAWWLRELAKHAYLALRDRPAGTGVKEALEPLAHFLEKAPRTNPRRNPRPQGGEAPSPTEVARTIERLVFDYTGERVSIAGQPRLQVWRALKVRAEHDADPLREVDFACLGRAWAVHPAGAHVYNSTFYSRNRVVLIELAGEIAPDAVDWEKTGEKATRHRQELELVLKPHARVRIREAYLARLDGPGDSRKVRLDTDGSVGPQTGESWALDCEEAFRQRRAAARTNPRRRARRRR
jgi:hypothetical protein